MNKDNDSRLFSDFFDSITDCLCEKLKKIEMCPFLNDNLVHSVADQWVREYRWLFYRCLIQDLASLKKQGMLRGQTPEEEYRDFCHRILRDESYRDSFFDRYCILYDVLNIKMNAFCDYVQEVLVSLKENQTEIIRQLCGGTPFCGIQEIEVGLSDEHYSGQQVMRLVLDNGYSVLYKTGDTVSLQIYQKILKSAETGCGFTDSYKNHIRFAGCRWESYVNKQPCTSEEEIREYYERMGLHLCLTYLLGISDLHYENIIPSGYLPIIVDTEVFPDYHLAIMMQENLDRIRQTVLRSGILPVYKKRDEYGDVNPMGGLMLPKVLKSSVKMPVIRNLYRSDMYINYEYSELNPSSFLPKIDDTDVDFRLYIPDLMEGFEKAYRYFINHRDVLEGVNVSGHRSRFLLRNTQEYFMYMYSSTFPELWSDRQKRDQFTDHLVSGLSCSEEVKPVILAYEKTCIGQCLFPVFLTEGRDMILGDGTRIPDYFPYSAEEILNRRLSCLSEKDLKRQKSMIRMNLLPIAERQILDIFRASEDGLPAECSYQSIAEEIMERYDPELPGGWFVYHYMNSGMIVPDQISVYLYHGLGGLLVFFTALKRCSHEPEAHTYQKLIEDRLWTHTFGHFSSETQVPLGLFDGEASLIYVWCLLYKITEEERYLDAAVYQADWLVSMIYHCYDYKEKVLGFDLISGIAGWMISLMMIYKFRGKTAYLELAKYLAKELEKTAVCCDSSESDYICWKNHSDDPALCGLAHGTSGVILALLRLWKLTKEVWLEEMIKKALRYEDAVYDEKSGNWRDLRPDSSRDTFGWCHGAPGILMVREELVDAGFYADNDKRVKETKDGMAWLKERLVSMRFDHACLCHGLCGLYELSGTSVGLFNKQLTEAFSVPDYENIGFMNGMAGIGYTLLKYENPDLPDVLRMDI